MTKIRGCTETLSKEAYMEITADIFRAATGQEPQQDDLERCNCKQPGDIGHYHCGWSSFLNRPFFMLPSDAIDAERGATMDEIFP